MTRSRCFTVLCLAVFGLAGAAAHAGNPPFPVDPFPYPYRSVAGEAEISSLRFNPAGLGLRQTMEFTWFHQFSGGESGGNNSIALRFHSLAASYNWLKHPQFADRRELLIGLGQQFGQGGSLGASWRYIMSDETSLNSRSLWTFGVMMLTTQPWQFGIRWENALHAKVDGVPTRGVFVAGARAFPMGPRLRVAVDWFYPEGVTIGQTELRLQAEVWVVEGANILAWVDTEKGVGIELRLLMERAAFGAEGRFTDFTTYRDGTWYLSAADGYYDNAKHPRTER